MPVNNRIADFHSRRPPKPRPGHDIHANPALLDHVEHTASFVADKLRAFGADDVVEGIGRTGVVAVIKGRTNTSWSRDRHAGRYGRAAHTGKAAILPHKSKVEGKMHACGHDGHTATPMRAAKHRSWRGNAQFRRHGGDDLSAAEEGRRWRQGHVRTTA